MESVIKEIEFLNNHYLKVGFLAIDSQKKGSNKTTILEYAIYNEFGTKSIPARPFLRNTLEFNKEKIENKIENLFNKVISGQINGITAYKELGEYVRDLIIETIDKANSWAIPLADSTVKKKGNNKILIDEGYLISSIRYQISTKNGTNIFISNFKAI
jgi:hypothetical protein|nr:MAG TPA: virion morphogenesis protein [Caudoviricetes sp.]